MKNCIYVGGLDGAADLESLFTTFSTFGEIVSIYFPTSAESPDGQQRNFAFVEYANELDARSAIDNMHLSEIASRVIRCNWAHTSNMAGSVSYERNKAIWDQDIAYEQE